jgi:hypothetical protein
MKLGFLFLTVFVGQKGNSRGQNMTLPYPSIFGHVGFGEESLGWFAIGGNNIDTIPT